MLLYILELAALQLQSRTYRARLLTRDTMRFSPFLCALLCVILVLRFALVGADVQPEAFNDPAAPGRTILSCVEVVGIEPQPGATFRRWARYLSFLITFSKPVFVEEQDTSGGFHPKSELDPKSWALVQVFLTPNQYTFAPVYPFKMNYETTNRRSIRYTFQVPPKFALTSRQFYLVVDGGSLYTYETIKPSTHYPVYVPLSIFGKFFFYGEDRTMSASITPSPYCNPRKVRPLPIDRGILDAGRLNLQVPDHGHWLEVNNGSGKNREITLRLNATVLGKLNGRGWSPLKPTLLAEYKGTNVTVKVPRLTLRIHKHYVWLIIPVERTLVYELRERIYHHTDLRMMVHKGPLYPINYDQSLFPMSAVLKHPWFWTWKVEMYDPVTGLWLATSFSEVNNTFGHPPLRQKERYEEWLKTNLPKMQWYKLTPTASAYSLANPPARGFRVVPRSSIRKHVKRQVECPANSRRNPGRYGKVYHEIEFGPFYHLLTPKPLTTWESKRALKIFFTPQNGNKTEIDVTNRVSFVGGSKGREVSQEIVEGLDKYVCLIKPRWNERFDENVVRKKDTLERCIFVPREVAESRGCGGLRLFENIENITREPAESFCSKDFGDCIGLPFTSEERFPVIPPYGLQELVGWYRYRDLPLNLPIGKHSPGRRLHPRSNVPLNQPIGRYSPGRVPRPRSMYWVGDTGRLMLVPQNLGGVLLEMRDIPVDGVEPMEPILAAPGGQTSGGDTFCKSVWAVTSLINSRGRETEADLTATVHNPGQGGADFVFELKCSSKLIVRPSSGEVTQWIPPETQALVNFHLDGNLVAAQREVVHKCEMNTRMRIAHDLFPNSVGKEAVSCSKWITTYNGAFIDPCTLPATPLPQHIRLDYHLLPDNQRGEASKLALEKFTGSAAGAHLVFIKTITIMLKVPGPEEYLVPNLNELRVYCNSTKFVVLREDQLLYEASESAQNPQAYTLPNSPVTFHTDFTAKRRVYFFGVRNWHQLVSACQVVVWANQPHRLCTKNQRKMAEVHVPLGERDIAAIEELYRWRFWFLFSLYGQQTDTVGIFLILSVIAAILLVIVTAIGRLVKYAFRKKLPQEEMIRKLKKELETAKQTDKELWENPQVYLETGPHGPFYVLHNFRATGKLDTEDLRELKVAGTLGHRAKELPVIFGHLKKVFLDQTSATEGRNVWLQASSGMYLLPYENVSPEYKEELDAFLLRFGVSVNVEGGARPDDPFDLPIGEARPDDPFNLPIGEARPDDPFNLPIGEARPDDPFDLPIGEEEELGDWLGDVEGVGDEGGKRRAKKRRPGK